MQYTRLGSTGATVSRICLGMMTYGDKASREWALDEEEARPLDQEGGRSRLQLLRYRRRLFDRRQRGDHRPAAQGLGPPREELFLATKVHGAMGEGPNMRGLSRKHIMQGIDASLKRLGMDYVDLYQIHRYDPTTPIEETLEALNDVVKAGKALYIGASSMFAWQFAQDARRLRTRTASPLRHHAEPLQSPLPRGRARDDPALPRGGHRPHPVEPAGARPADAAASGGGRDDPRARPTPSASSSTTARDDMAIVDAVTEIAKKRGVPNAQVALAWVLAQPGDHRADHRRQQGRATSRTPSKALDLTLDADETEGAGRALPAASDRAATS